MSVHVFLANGFEEVEALSTVDVLRRAGVDVATVTINSTHEVIGSHNIPIKADFTFEEALNDDCEMIMLPGGLPGATNLAVDERLSDLILDFNSKGKWLTAICAAPMVYGELGILDGKNATCYPGFETHLKGANYVEEPCVVDGNIITGRGPAFAFPFALKILECLAGEDKMHSVAKGMLLL